MLFRGLLAVALAVVLVVVGLQLRHFTKQYGIVRTAASIERGSQKLTAIKSQSTILAEQSNSFADCFVPVQRSRLTLALALLETGTSELNSSSVLMSNQELAIAAAQNTLKCNPNDSSAWAIYAWLLANDAQNSEAKKRDLAHLSIALAPYSSHAMETRWRLFPAMMRSSALPYTALIQTDLENVFAYGRPEFLSLLVASMEPEIALQLMENMGERRRVLILRQVEDLWAPSVLEN